VMFRQQYFSIDRIPVGMYIERRHKNGNYNSFILEIFVFVHFFYGYYFTVGGCYHYSVAISFELAIRTSVEIEDDPKKDKRYASYNVGPKSMTKEIP
jgi:hypothetical protein